MPIDVRDSQDVYKGIGESVDFVILNLKHRDQKAELEAVRALAALVPAVIRSMNIRRPDDDLKVAVGFGSDAWDYLFPGKPKPHELQTFEALGSGETAMPATGGDIFLHVRAKSASVVYEVISQLMPTIKAATKVLDETHGFGYFEGRAIIGFIDGTEAPDADDAPEYAIIGDEDPDFTNGSYAFTQRWIHNMKNWDSRTTEDQEKAVGRRKFSDLELADQDKAPNAHNIASQDMDGGVEHKIVRMNVPFSDPAKGVTGTYFIGYARQWAVTARMLANMVDKKDALFSFSYIETGAQFFIPSKHLLDAIGEGDF
jgi:putative iron-dependent peroxidase